MDVLTHCNTSSSEALVAIRNCNSMLVLDFDYNLYLGNSTEDFLSTLRPAWLAYLLICCITFFVRTFGPFWGISLHVWRDFLWAQLTWFLFPWALAMWPKRAMALASTKFNQDMIDAVQSSRANRVVVISFGYRHIQRALADELPFEVELVTSNVGMKPNNLRTFTKSAAIRSMASNEELTNAVFVTDSKDDFDLLSLFNNSYCVSWTHSQPFPFSGVYVPFRYTAEGKYAVPDIIWNQHVTEDLMVLLIAYASSFISLLAVPFLFISFFCVYEMGYYENNTLAASCEENPTIATGHAAFENYGIYRKGTLWATVTGSLGCLLCEMPFRTAALYWAGALLLSRIIFHFFNRLSSHDRIFLFPFLQIAKTFSFAPLLSIGPAGALLLVSQVMRQTTNYMIYRNNGNIRNFKRQAHRLLVFIMGTVVLLMTGPHFSLIGDWRFYVALLWCIYRVIREAWGHGLQPAHIFVRKMGLKR